MPIAAVPAYLGQNFKDASPALRFGMLLPLWGINRRTKQLLWSTSDIDYEVRGRDHQEREVKKENKESALRQAAQLNKTDIESMHALAARQQRLAASPAFSRHMLTLCATATAPFTTGLGNEHPLENGFAFLTPYGLPYLAGSGVKGVLRQAARELAEGRWGDTSGWSKEKTYPITADGKTTPLSMLDVLFGYEAGSGETLHTSGILDFWDVIPQIPSKELAVEVMTPHQTHYYQKKESPHDSGQPNPITFLTVPPGSGMNFYVRCDEVRLKILAPELLESWRSLLAAAFEHAFEWLGFGAKTAVGYGAMQRDDKKEEEQLKAAKAQKDADEKAKKEQARQEAKKQLSPAMQQVSDFESTCEQYKEKIGSTFERIQKGSGFYPVAKRLRDAAAQGDWSAEEKAAAKAAIERWLPEIFGAKSAKDARKELKLGALAPAA